MTEASTLTETISAASLSGVRVEGASSSSMREDVDGSVISGRSSSAVVFQTKQELEEDIQRVIEPTRELRVRDDEQELIYWKSQLTVIDLIGVSVRTVDGTPNDEFFDRKNIRLGGMRRQDFRALCVYLLPCYPLNKEDKSVRLG
eukprot:919334-Amphidinium_carterae.2